MKNLIIHNKTHARTRQREVPDRGQIGVPIYNSLFFAHAPSALSADYLVTPIPVSNPIGLT